MGSLEAEAVRIWDSWQIRVLVLLSLTLQIILTWLGKRRRYISGIWIKITVYSAYLLADWVAPFALGKMSYLDISNTDHQHPNNALKALWAPMLLVHLGGPDTITAYSIEDVRLWIRPLLQLIFQVSTSIYVTLPYWTWTTSPDLKISFLEIPLLVAGIIKYGERIWALWYANNDNPTTIGNFVSRDDYKPIYHQIKKIPQVEMILNSYIFFQTNKQYIADYVSPILIDEVESMKTFADDPKILFKCLELELEFMYDVLYTKKTIIFYAKCGWVLRGISFICLLTGLVGFSIIPRKHEHYSIVDVWITYVLVVGAIILDIYGFVLMIFSKWGIVWMIKLCKNDGQYQVLESLAKSLNNWKRWSESVAQFNMLKFCFQQAKKPSKTAAIIDGFLKLVGKQKKFRMYQCQTKAKDLNDFKVLIDLELEKIGEQLERLMPDVEIIRRSAEEFSTRRGILWALKRHECEKDLEWSIQKDFDESIIIWHIATDICYNNTPPWAASTINHVDDDDEEGGTGGCKIKKKEANRKETSKLVSEYMMYLLVNHPNMLGVTAANFLFEPTCTDLDKIIKSINIDDKLENENNTKIKCLCEKLLLQELGSSSSISGGHDGVLVNWDQIKGSSLVKSGVKLAREILEKKFPGGGGPWELINSVWLDIISSAALQCQVNYHAQHLRSGGELLTHVWVCLSHTPLSKKFGKQFRQLTMLNV